MKISKLRLACLIIIGLYILSNIYLGISAYRFYILGDHLVAMAVAFDSLFWLNTKIHGVILVLVIVGYKVYKRLLE